jgi:HAE1 family hydrophobic/amphiphilic exporter-1
MDTVAFIGCILMVGVVVNNGIVIVDHITQLRRDGVPRFDAVMQGGNNRLRPVLMTALTTILGALPLVAPLAFPHIGNPATVSLGCTIIGGLATGTLLTLFVVPLFYTFIDDLQNWLLKYFAAIAGLIGRQVSPAPPAA